MSCALQHLEGPGDDSLQSSRLFSTYASTAMDCGFFLGLQTVLCCADVTVCVADFRVWIDGPAAVPNDPDLPQQWALNDIKVGSVWAANQFGHKDIKVCMVDTGSDLTHPDLQANLWMNPGEVNGPGANSGNGYVNGKDDDGNGTAWASPLKRYRWSNISRAAGLQRARWTVSLIWGKIGQER